MYLHIKHDAKIDLPPLRKQLHHGPNSVPDLLAKDSQLLTALVTEKFFETSPRIRHRNNQRKLGITF